MPLSGILIALNIIIADNVEEKIEEGNKLWLSQGYYRIQRIGFLKFLREVISVGEIPSEEEPIGLTE
jgi:hypothetical protein